MPFTFVSKQINLLQLLVFCFQVPPAEPRETEEAFGAPYIATQGMPYIMAQCLTYRQTHSNEQQEKNIDRSYADA